MADPIDLQAKIDVMDAKIERLENKEERLESSSSDGGNTNASRRPRSADVEEVAGGAAGRGQGTADRNEQPKHKKRKNGVEVVIKNEGGAAAIAVGGSRAAGAGASRAGGVEYVSEDRG